MARADLATALYVVNFALLATHQVDAAFWREWDVFGVPGGLPFFLVFNLVAVGVLAAGLVQVSRAHRSARLFSILCAATGGVTVALHAVFLVRDRVAFWAPASLVVLGAIAVASAAQLVIAFRAPRAR